MSKNLWMAFLLLNLLALTNCSPSQGIISGLVYDQNGPVAGAVVRVQTTEFFTTSDANGSFTLDGLSPAEPVKLTAWAPGYYIVGGEKRYLPGMNDVELELIPHTEVDNPGYEWISAFASEGDPNNCQNCHSYPDDPASTLPFDEWQLDAHSRSTLNERFLTMYSGTDLSGNQSPHTRRGFSRDYGSIPLRPDPSQPYYGPGYKLDFPGTSGNCGACHVPAAAINKPYGADPTRVTDVGKEGVACDFCHKVWDVRLQESGFPYPNMPGVLSFEFRRPSEGHQFFAGPFDDVAPGEDTFSPLQQQSQFCAPCHFGVFWDTIIYNSYGEWLNSPYNDPDNGKTCQDCHMPNGLTDHFARTEEGGHRRDPETIFSHRMPGASDEDFLQNAVSMSVDAEWDTEEIVLQVKIVNDSTGHHIPTDSPLRHMILLVQVSDSEDNQLVQLDGPTLPDWVGIGDPAQGYYAGLPGTVYAKVLQELWTELFPTGAYWNATRVLMDNRIPAFGTATTSFSFITPPEGEVSIEVSLIFRRAFIELADQKEWNVPDIVMTSQMFEIDLDQ
jgi:nitrate/TMAO reductase-like tetraheme cytochrome c subunit